MTRARLMLATGLIALAAAPVAMAHVEVLPSSAVKGQSTEFTVRVPAEGGLTTTQVRVTFPTEVSVYAVADAPGWTSRILKRPDGRFGLAYDPAIGTDLKVTPVQDIALWPMWDQIRSPTLALRGATSDQSASLWPLPKRRAAVLNQPPPQRRGGGKRTGFA